MHYTESIIASVLATAKQKYKKFANNSAQE